MASIYKHFAASKKIPIYLKDIKNFVLQTGEAHAITRFPVDIDDLYLRGMLRVFRDRPPYAIEDRVMAQIAYYEGLDERSMRLVCTKEMLHLLDNHGATASTREQVSQLIEEITLPLEAVASLPGLTDHTKLIDALCVLVPYTTLNILRPFYKDQKISVEDLARLARIPEPFARVALSEPFENLQKHLISCD